MSRKLLCYEAPTDSFVRGIQPTSTNCEPKLAGRLRWTPKFGPLAKVGSRPRRRSLACHGRDGVILAELKAKVALEDCARKHRWRELRLPMACYGHPSKPDYQLVETKARQAACWPALSGHERFAEALSGGRNPAVTAGGLASSH